MLAMLELVLAHGGHGHGESLPLAAIAIAAMVIPLCILGVIARLFLRAARRDAETTERG